VSTPIKQTLHSTHTEERTERRVIIDATMICQLMTLAVPQELLDVTPEPCELPERFRRLDLVEEGEDE
jgi:hypothetical protein